MLKDALVAVYRAMPAADPAHYVRGQYEGYRAIDGVAPDSTTETYAALRLEIDNWRWSGVPFFIRTGKCLPVTQTELRVVFRRPPKLGFAGWSRVPEPSQFVVKLDPSTGIRLLVDAQRHEAVEPEQINLDMEFAQEGGEGPTPYEVLLHAALIGDSKRFTRQDGVEECWRVMAPLLEHPPPVHPYAKGSWGPVEAEQVLAGYGRWHEPVGGVMSTDQGPEERAARRSRGRRAEPAAAPTPQSAAAPSPFTPIASYGFLSNCHTGALVAPDGTVDWLCVPRFDSPSVFGALLDRGAGGFRFGPFGINVPSERVYEPGTNSLITSWRTPSGWATVRDSLTMGPRRGEDTTTPHTRPPADEDAEHVMVRTAFCVEGSVEIDLVCEPAFDYGRVPAEWTLSDDRHHAEASGAGQTLRLQTDMLIGIEARPGAGAPRAARGEAVYCALGWAEEAHLPDTPRKRSISSRPPPGSGATGWRGRGSPTTSSGR